jgi:hypothetical protein
MADHEGGAIRRTVSRALAAAADEASDMARQVADPACAKLVEELRLRCPGAFPPGPLPPGQVAPPVTIDPGRSLGLYSTTFAAAAGAAPSAAGAPSQVVWADGEHELLVIVAKVRILLQDGFVLVGVPVYTEQTGAVEICVPFAVGGKGAPTGLMIATEKTPRGPALLVERWGDQLIAVAWQALVHFAGGIAGAAGSDDAGQPLIPASLTAGPAGLTVLPQAAHSLDRAHP